MQLWTKDHAVTLLPAVAVMVLIGFVLRWLLKEKSETIRLIPYQVIACLLVVIEIGKQVISFKGGYDLYHLPFHFCSLFIFMVPLMAFYRGKHKQTVRAITSALCMSVFLMMMIYPCLIYGDWNIRGFFTEYISFHTVVFHNLVVFVSTLTVLLPIHEPAPKREAKAAAVFTACFCAVSATMAQLLKTNFNNFYVCNIPPLEVVRQSVETACGSVAAMLLYVLIVSVLDILFVQMAYRLYRLLRKLTVEKEKIAQ